MDSPPVFGGTTVKEWTVWTGVSEVEDADMEREDCGVLEWVDALGEACETFAGEEDADVDMTDDAGMDALGLEDDECVVSEDVEV